MLGTASLWVGSRTAPRLNDFVLSTLPSMFPHLVATFMAACIWKIVSGLKSGLWFLGALVPSIQSFVILHLHRRLVCACLVCEVTLTS
ncbi:hypothetical protein HID58_047062 [Brassica napus]|uniref:Uncharacterized protein n=1 Tax=Brassica napus TaxID=3708 RepID=A0ABQ8AYD1_BRANA|nr:hypothetical protein HID58_047062 [Brassica napus]